MTKTIIVGGYGPGVSSAVAERFGAEGFAVALVGRNVERLAAGVKALTAKGIRAEAFPADLSKPDQIRAMVAKVQGSLGVISVLQWSAYAGTAGDLTTATSAELSATLDVAVTGLVAAVQATLPDLRATKGAVLVTNGGLGFFDPKLDAMAVEWNAMGLSVANSAKHKAAAMLAHKLKPDGVYVGEIMVTGTIKGTAFDQGNATIAASTISEKFWQLYQDRTQASVTI